MGRISSILVIMLWVVSCYETPSTVGLICEVDDHCDADQLCVAGVCQFGGPLEGRACDANGAFYCGYGECFCDADAPFCCGDGRCYSSMDDCAAAWGVDQCPGGGDCSVCRVLDDRIDFCPGDAPYCCFENGTAAQEVYCNQQPQDPCG